MPLIGEVGDIHETSGEISLQWEIPNFFSLPKDGYYESPVFAFSQSCWCFRLYIQGYTGNFGEEWISLHLVRKGSHLPMSVDIKFGIIGRNGLQMTESNEKANVKNDGFGPYKFYSRNPLKLQKSQLVSLDTLTVCCKIGTNIKKSTKASHFQRLWNCIRDLKALLDVEDKKDFTFHLRDDEKRSAHKVILESRSDYFKKMFGNEWLENKTGEGHLSHIEKEVFENVLSYLYSGDAENLNEKNAWDIYVVAHELQLEELKQLCIEHMKASLSMKSICNILLFVEKYEEEKELKEFSIQFLAQNAKEVFGSDAWGQFKEENPGLAFSLLQNVILEKMILIET